MTISMPGPNKLPITAIVASYNEGHLLERCLSALFFCDEIIVINLLSTDNTVEIARKYATRILNYPHYPIVEQALYYAIPEARHEWILLTDPDEETSIKLANHIIKLFQNKEVYQYSAVRVPIQFYFKSTPLKGTIWGGYFNNCRYMFRKGHFSVYNEVHGGTRINDSKKILNVYRSEYSLVNHHYWMTSWHQLFEKHHRYNSKEAQKLFNTGETFSLKKQLLTTIKAFRSSYIITRGYKDGIIGLLLSIFWAYYNFMNWHELKKLQNQPK
ncbi:glycosyltransferase [Pedobacter sp. BS3]|uniref:glycosyltransferase n=1 Tax=Pedobacter sp. BS3 TaxID=2567937 RepID=UPI0016595EB0|nr:glycosyltransferase [Pedobacter sp. BS3]